MKRFFNILSAAIICVALTSPSVVAQGRSGRGATQTSQHRQAPASGNRSDHGSNGNGASSRGNARPASGTQNHSSQTEHKRPDKSQVRTPQATGKHNGTPAGMQQTNTNKVQPSAADRRPNNTNTGRPGNGGHGNDNSATRPGNNGTNHPGNGNNTSATRPGNNGNNRPGNAPGNNAFGPGNNSGDRLGPNHGNPGGSAKPNHGNNHQRPNNPGTPQPPAYGYGPGGDRWHGNFHDIPHHAPHRPMLPPPPPHYYRPTPPPAFRPAPNGPRFGTILGIALGSAINYTLDQLFNSGYYVTGYTNNAVYLNDVLMLNLVWPNVTLQYNHGRLIGSEFVYPSAYYNTDRYYQAYNRLQSSYGVPVSMDYLAGGGMQASWFGYDGRYVTLTFQGGTAMDGQIRYYTTLSFGN